MVCLILNLHLLCINMRTAIIIISSIFTILVVSVIYFMYLDFYKSTKSYHKGVVIETNYIPSSRSTGTIINSDGSVGFIQSNTHEKSYALVYLNDKVTKVNVDKDYIFKINKNDTINFYTLSGYYSGYKYSNTHY